MPVLTPRARFATGMAAGLALIGSVAVVEIAHMATVLASDLERSGARLGFVGAGLGVLLPLAILAGAILGAAFAALNLAARALVPKAGDPALRGKRIALVEALIVFLGIVAAAAGAVVVAPGPTTRFANAAVMILKRYASFLAETWFDGRLPLGGVAAVAAVPAATLAWFWRRVGISDLATRGLAEKRGAAAAALRLVLALAAMAAGLAAYFVTATAYVNQYRDLHLLGILGAGVCFAAAFLLLPSAARLAIEAPFVRRGGLAALALLLVAGLGSAHLTLSRSQAAEAALLWRTDLARKAVAVVRALTDRDHDGFSAWFGGDDPDDGDPRALPWWLAPSSAEDGPHSLPPRLGKFTLDTPLDHVAMVSVDALRTDLVGHLGARPSSTPRLDALAARAVRFHRAYAPGSFTHATYPAILAARHPIPGLDRGRSFPTFPRVLREAGVTTSGVFCAFFHGDGGFEHVDLSIPHDAPEPGVTSAALVRKELERNAPRHVFWVHLIDPHEPYVDRTKRAPAAGEFERYLSEIRASDAIADEIVEAALARFGPKTAVMIFADHGEEWSEHGSRYHGITAYEELIHVPLVVSVPGIEPKDIHQPASLVHLAPTVLDLLHVEAPPSFHGRSLVPLMVGSEDPGFDPTVLAVNNDDTVAIFDRTGRWKLVFDTQAAFVELYDLADDPGERRNRADQEPERLRAMQALYRRFRDAHAAER